MRTPDVTQQVATLRAKPSADEYNFDHFRTRHLVHDAQRTLARHGIQPGKTAPDFQLPRVGGGSLRLSDLRDKPTLLHFGSFS